MRKTLPLVLVGLAAPAWAGPVTYTANILPQLDSTDEPFSLTYTTPHGMNGSGHVTGELGDGRGFAWAPSGWSDLISHFGGAADRVVGGSINDSGAIAGNYAPAGEFAFRPFHLSAGGDLTLLPTLAPGLDASMTRMNNAGMIVGTAEREDGGMFTGPSTSVFWRDGQIHEIGGFGGNNSVATSVNNNGVVTGYSNAVSGQPVSAYRWTEGGGFEMLEGFISNMPNLTSDINDHGVVVGHAALTMFQNTAAYWDAEGNIHELGRLDANSSDIDVRAVNNSGVMVGMELMSDDFMFHARLWQDGAVYDLQDLVTGLPDGFVLADARDINDAGQIVVEGNMMVDDQLQFFTVVLTPVPAPGAAGLLAMGGLVALRRRR